jgi:predicted MPP superfamily phosphohydrolase
VSEPAGGRWVRRAPRRLGAVRWIAAALLLVALDALWLEPRVLLVPQRVRLDVAAPPLRVAHLSDLHIEEETWQLRRLLAQVAAARPDLVLMSGDWVRDVPEEEPFARHAAAAAAFARELARIAPVYSVQGHSEYQGSIVGALEDAGVVWLGNRGAPAGPRGVAPSTLLLGINQQVGEDAYVPHWHPPFRVVDRGGQPIYGAVRGLPFKDFYSHYDPAPASLTDERGPLSWSGYEVVCDTLIDGPDVGSGIAVHSRYVVGEDRMIRLRRVKPEESRPGSFFLLAQGSTLSGQPDTGVDPEPGRWYRLRLKAVALPDRVMVFARVWPADAREPALWQASAEDRSPRRATAGTVGLGAWGGGTVLYRNLRVIGNDGRLLLADPLTEPAGPSGFRQGTRGTRLALALARSPAVPAGTPRVVLSHTPDVTPEASRRGIEVVLAGHTHGGQVRLPFVGALLTRTAIGPAFDRGLFAWAAPNARGWTSLYVNPGIGTSLLPIRFWDPPGWAEVEVGR